MEATESPRCLPNVSIRRTSVSHSFEKDTKTVKKRRKEDLIRRKDNVKAIASNYTAPHGRMHSPRRNIMLNSQISFPSKSEISEYRKEVRSLTKRKVKPTDKNDSDIEIIDERIMEKLSDNGERVKKKKLTMMNDLSEKLDIHEEQEPFPLKSSLKARDGCGIPNSLSFL